MLCQIMVSLYRTPSRHITLIMLLISSFHSTWSTSYQTGLSYTGVLLPISMTPCCCLGDLNSSSLITINVHWPYNLLIKKISLKWCREPILQFALCTIVIWFSITLLMVRSLEHTFNWSTFLHFRKTHFHSEIKGRFSVGHRSSFNRKSLSNVFKVRKCTSLERCCKKS